MTDPSAAAALVALSESRAKSAQVDALLTAAVGALVAVEHLTENRGDALTLLDWKIADTAERGGVGR